MRPSRRSLLAAPTLLWLILGLAALRPADARGQLLTYNFSGGDGTASTARPGITGGEFGRDPDSAIFFDFGAGRPAPDANSSGWTTNPAAPDLAAYYAFTLTAAAPTTLTGLSLDAARFDSEGINDGPTRFTLRTSLDGFAANLGGGTLTGVFTTFNVPLALTAPAAAAVEFRLYGFAAGSSAGLFQIDNVTVVPEPATHAFLLAAGGVALAAWGVRRRSARA